MAAKTTRKDPVERKEGDERKKALNAALASIEKQFGKGAIMRMADGVEQQNIEVVSTGSLGLDLALGVGGLPRGRIVEIYGPESSGKTTLSLQVIAEMQKIGGTCALSMPNMHWIFSMLSVLASMCRNCFSLSQMPVNRHWKLSTRWYVRVPST